MQDTIEGRLEKRTKGIFAPPGGKHLVTFIDDLNMPQKSKFGFIPPLELLKLWCDNGFWYDRLKCEVKEVKDMQLFASMAPPGGGRNAFSQRVMACFSMICVSSPNDSQLRKIYGSLMSAHLADFDDQLKPMGDQIAAASVDLYRAVVNELLPTPSKSHYLFNTRDLAKIVQGTMQSTKSFYDTKDSMLALWCHETFRVIGDRMWDPQDKTWLQKQLEERLASIFSVSWADLFEPYGGDIPPFANFLRPMESPPFEPVVDLSTLKQFLTEKLEDYALEPGKSAMDLVLFTDALMHLCRISRILNQPRGNALLVGVGVLPKTTFMHIAKKILLHWSVILYAHVVALSVGRANVHTCQWPQEQGPRVHHCDTPEHRFVYRWFREEVAGPAGNIRDRTEVLRYRNIKELQSGRVSGRLEGPVPCSGLSEQAHDLLV